MKKISVVVFLLIAMFLFSSCSVFFVLEEFSNKNILNDETKTSNSEIIDQNKKTKSGNSKAFDSSSEIFEIPKIAESNNNSYTPIDLKNAYNHLENNSQKEIYNSIFKVVYLVENEVNKTNGYYFLKPINCGQIEDVKISDMVVALVAFKNDNPQYFWVSTDCFIDLSADEKNMYIYSLYSLGEIKEMSMELSNAVNRIVSSMADDLTEYERELYLHDIINEICDYNDEAVKGDNYKLEEYFNCFNIYGALVDGNAVCQGYADAFSYLLSCVGVNNTQISNQEHTWNAVELDGEWYNVDLTWNDTTQSYYYFNIIDDELREDHQVAPLYTQMTEEEITGTDDSSGLWFNVFIPECDSTKYSYYNQGQ